MHFCRPVGVHLAYLFIGLKLTRLGMLYCNTGSDRFFAQMAYLFKTCHTFSPRISGWGEAGIFV